MNSNFSLTWEKISVEVVEKHSSFWTTSKKTKTVLKNISGVAKNNTLIAIMGASGSGKTTFLGSISGRIKEKEGILKINNKIVTNDMIKNISGYMQQEDIFTETLNVYEHMRFMTALKLNKTNEERKQVVGKLISELSLEKQKSTIIKFLSGGERRRLSLATELINDPLIMFCDEPTTGLDSFSAMSVGKKLESTALNGKIVVLTVHQPSSQLFNHFHELILLANGQLIFQGTKDEAAKLFERANLFCPLSYNPADFYIKCLTNNEENCNSNQICHLGQLFDSNRPKINWYKNEIGTSNITLKHKVFEKSFFYELNWLVWRVSLDAIRNSSRYFLNSSLMMVTSLLLALSYSFVEVKAPNSVQNIQGALAFIVSELIFSHMYFVIYIFPGEVAIFMREKKLYSPLPYYLSKLLTLIPNCLLNSFCFLLIYFMILQFLDGIGLFFSMYIVLCTTSLVASAFGLCLSALFPTVEYIDLFIVPLELLCMTLSGIWIKIDTLPWIFGLIKYVSPFYFSFESISTLHWENVGNLDNCTQEAETVPVPCYASGEDVLFTYGFLTGNNVVFHNILYLHVLIIFYCFVGYLGIIRKRALYNSY